jgi:AraC family transcriptional regulator, transcriptional activator FtrA
MPKSRKRPNRPNQRLVAALLFEGLGTFEMGIVAEVFGLSRPELGVDWYDFVTVSERRQPVRASGGIRVLAEAGLDRLRQAGTIVVPGWRTDGAPPSPRIASELRSAHARGARIVSICSGAFLLASCGLLEQRRATTHWRYADKFRQLFPDVELDADVLYVDEGDVLTSAGSAAGVDLLLHIVRRDYGARIANEVARRMVMPPHREGGQAQFIPRPIPTQSDDRLGPLLEAIRDKPAEAWTIARMARAAAMSERTLARRFQDATGVAPGEWVTQMRTEAARYLLETTDAGLEAIASGTGFGSAANLRHHFKAHVGLAPRTYRVQYAGCATEGAAATRPAMTATSKKSLPTESRSTWPTAPLASPARSIRKRAAR